MASAQTAASATNVATLKATRLWLSAGLEPADRDALVRECGDVRAVRAGTPLLREGAKTDVLHVLLDGWAARYTVMADGSRFISALALPGDVCDLDALRFDQLNYGVTMLSAGTVIVLPRKRVDELLTSHPAIARALWSLALAENTILTTWTASIARRSAQGRLAHLLCELLLRLQVVGKATGNSYDFPMTQEHLADALGLTPVHINRTLQSLRSTGAITLQNRRVTICNWEALRGLCNFNPRYLHLETVHTEFARTLSSTRSLGSESLPPPSRPKLVLKI